MLYQYPSSQIKVVKFRIIREWLRYQNSLEAEGYKPDDCEDEGDCWTLWKKDNSLIKVVLITEED